MRASHLHNMYWPCGHETLSFHHSYTCILAWACNSCGYMILLLVVRTSICSTLDLALLSQVVRASHLHNMYWPCGHETLSFYHSYTCILAWACKLVLTAALLQVVALLVARNIEHQTNDWRYKSAEKIFEISPDLEPEV